MSTGTPSSAADISNISNISTNTNTTTNSGPTGENGNTTTTDLTNASLIGPKVADKSVVADNNADNGRDESVGFDNGIEFILTCLGLSVGLGNIWRFPTRAYENGGSAFLIPYLICAVCFGLPVVYLEFLIGQHSAVSPPIAFRRIMPALEGVGWMTATVSGGVAIYYIVIVAWIAIYLVNIFRGHLSIWNTCENDWNDKSTCIDMLAQKNCIGEDPFSLFNSSDGNSTEPTFSGKMVFINGSCRNVEDFANVTFMSATEQYFQNYLVRPSSAMFDINGLNFPVLTAMFICWMIAAFGILKGMKMIGKISYVTVILPYVIVFILFIRGITLDGASDGLYFYLGRPDFSLLFSTKIWTEALKQLCFSLSVGVGALMTIASYSRKKHNCFKDAAILICGDTLMSLIGGAGVFSTLGFLAKQRGVTVPEVVRSGFALSFVVYPEAMTQMPIPWLWAFLFFFMLFLLGISTEIAIVELFVTCLSDRFPKLRKRRILVVCCWCLVLFLLGVQFATDAGIYWLTMFDEYASGFASVCTCVVEVLVIVYVYKVSNFRVDMIEMIGEARNKWTAAFGPLSPYFVWNWRIISPLVGTVLVALSFIRDYPFENSPEVYPLFFDVCGWFLAFLPVFMIPAFAIYNYIDFTRKGYPGRAVFSTQKQHPSYNRIIKELDEETRNEMNTILPNEEPWTKDDLEAKNESRQLLVPKSPQAV